MKTCLGVESFLEHDGDGIVRYRLTIQNDCFRATTQAWGNDDDHLRFAEALTGFPATSASTLTHSLGSDGSGTCTLEFFCLDNLGHVGLWTTIVSDYPMGPSKRHEQACAFLRCDPAAIDRFVSDLRRFTAGSPNCAELQGSGP